MKVLYIIDGLKVGGTEQSWLAMLPSFRTVDPIVCTIYAPDGPLRSMFEAAGIPVIALNIGARYGFPTAIRRVREVVRRERPALLHAALFRADVVARAVARVTGVPLVDSLVNDSYAPVRFQHLSFIGRAKVRIAQLLDAATARWVDHFIAISEAVKAAHVQQLRVPADRITVIHRGRDPARYAPPSPTRAAALRRSLDVAPDSPLILNVSRLIHRKGQEELVAAFALLRTRYPTARLLIAGEGDHRARLEALIAERGLENEVRLLGTRADVPDLLNAADVFVFTSHYEGHGGALVEAMLAGKPIVASDTPVHRESITDGVTGICVPLFDPSGIAEGISWMLDHPSEAKAMGQGAREDAGERFSISGIADRYERCYADVLARRALAVDGMTAQKSAAVVLDRPENRSCP